MGLGLLLVPALAGYLLHTVLYRFRYRTLRESGQHVVFRSALTGIVLAFFAQLILHIVSNYVPRLETYLCEVFGFEYSAVAVLSFFLALVIWPVCNFFTDRDSAAIRAAKENGDLKGVFVTEAIATFKTIEVSLNTGKVYIGKISQSGIGISSQFDLMITPLFSGYRNRETNELKITQFYHRIIRDMKNKRQSGYDQDSREQKNDWNELRIGVSLSDVISVRFFDPKLYREFSKDGEIGE